MAQVVSMEVNLKHLIWSSWKRAPFTCDYRLQSSRCILIGKEGHLVVC